MLSSTWPRRVWQDTLGHLPGEGCRQVKGDPTRLSHRMSPYDPSERLYRWLTTSCIAVVGVVNCLYRLYIAVVDRCRLSKSDVPIATLLAEHRGAARLASGLQRG